jgi:small GTP-binding protein
MSTLKCPSCNEDYVDNDKSEKAPKVLSCGHTFCCKCIKQKMKKDKNEIICSVDRIKDKRTFEEIPFNRTIYDLILERQQKSVKKENKINEKCDLVLNIGMIGSQCAGKTSLSKCYQDGKPLPDINFYEPTVGLDYFYRIINVDGKKIKILIWDTTGQERFNSITSGYLRGLHGCFIVYDVSNNNSFESLDNWIQFYKDFNQYKKRIMIILGNKIDIKERVIKTEEGKKFAKDKDLPYFETSSITMQNVNEAFEKMAKMILESQNENNLKRSESKTKLKKEKHKKGKEKEEKKSSGGWCS